MSEQKLKDYIASTQLVGKSDEEITKTINREYKKTIRIIYDKLHKYCQNILEQYNINCNILSIEIAMKYNAHVFYMQKIGISKLPEINTMENMEYLIQANCNFIAMYILANEQEREQLFYQLTNNINELCTPILLIH